MLASWVLGSYTVWSFRIEKDDTLQLLSMTEVCERFLSSVSCVHSHFGWWAQVILLFIAGNSLRVAGDYRSNKALDTIFGIIMILICVAVGITFFRYLLLNLRRKYLESRRNKKLKLDARMQEDERLDSLDEGPVNHVAEGSLGECVCTCEYKCMYVRACVYVCAMCESYV